MAELIVISNDTVADADQVMANFYELEERIENVETGDGASTPTGTGFVHVTDGEQDVAAKLVANADISANAAIAESKLDLASDAAAGVASRRSLGTGATQAAAGNHSHSNATASTSGFQSATDKLKLDNATANATASTLALRDSSGRLAVAAPSSGGDAANKTYVDSAVSAGAADADESTKGIAKLSVAPSGEPVAVGTNDPRVAAFGGAGAGHTSGLVPDPGATENTTDFLRRDGSWAQPPAGTLAVTQQGNAAINDVDTLIFSGASVSDNEDGSATVTVSSTPTGGAGGALSGSYPNPGLNNEVVQDMVAAFITAGSGISKNYDDENNQLILSATGGGGGGGTGTANQREIEQAAHGLTLGDWVKHASGGYTKAQADEAANAEVLGIVAEVEDADTFTLASDGFVSGLSGLTADTLYFLDASTPGQVTATEPSTPGEVSRPVFYAVSTTSGYILNYRGYVVPEESEGGGGGVEIEFASQAEAEAGTITDKAMSPLRTAQAIAALAPSEGPGAFVGVSVRTENSQSIDSNTPVAILFNLEDYDSHAFHSTSSNTSRLTTPATHGGTYLVCGATSMTANSTGRRILSIRKNGTEFWGQVADTTPSGTYASQMMVTAHVPLGVGDYVELVVIQESGVSLSTGSGGSGARPQWFQMSKIGV